MATPLIVDLGASRPYSKLELATMQLERAIQLYIDEKDYVSSVTLAGAAEEILGTLLTKRGKTPVLHSFVQLCMFLGQAAPGDKEAYATYRDMENAIRNGLKHYSDGEDIEVPQAAAADMIERAIDNFIRLTGRDSTAILRYMASGPIL